MPEIRRENAWDWGEKGGRRKGGRGRKEGEEGGMELATEEERISKGGRGRKKGRIERVRQRKGERAGEEEGGRKGWRAQ